MDDYERPLGNIVNFLILHEFPPLMSMMSHIHSIIWTDDDLGEGVYGVITAGPIISYVKILIKLG